MNVSMCILALTLCLCISIIQKKNHLSHSELLFLEIFRNVLGPRIILLNLMSSMVSWTFVSPRNRFIPRGWFVRYKISIHPPPPMHLTLVFFNASCSYDTYLCYITLMKSMLQYKHITQNKISVDVCCKKFMMKIRWSNFMNYRIDIR